MTDGKGGTNTATVQISVVDPLNNPPVALDDSATTTNGVPVTLDVISGAFGGADSDPDPTNVLTVKSIVEQPSHGTVVIGADNSITYTPVPGYGGPDQLVYLLADGEGGFDTATVSLLVFSGTAPVARDDATTININEQVTINVLEGTTGGTDSDLDGDDLTVLQITRAPDPSSGSATLNSGELLCPCCLLPFSGPPSLVLSSRSAH